MSSYNNEASELEDGTSNENDIEPQANEEQNHQRPRNNMEIELQLPKTSRDLQPNQITQLQS